MCPNVSIYSVIDSVSFPCRPLLLLVPVITVRMVQTEAVATLTGQFISSGCVRFGNR